MASLLDGLRTMARDLLKDPDVYLHTWIEPARAVPEEDLARAEEKIGARLPAELRELYAAMDGFGIVWAHRDDWDGARDAFRFGKKHFKGMRERCIDKGLPWTDGTGEKRFELMADVGEIDHRATGHVRIPPLRRLLNHPEYKAIIAGLKAADPKGTMPFDGATPIAHKLYSKFLSLDTYSASEQAFLYTGPGPRHMRVHRMSCYYKLYDSDPHVSITDYFDEVIRTHGRTRARKPLFQRPEED
jgi:hypothetical protein